MIFERYWSILEIFNIRWNRSQGFSGTRLFEILKGSTSEILSFSKVNAFQKRIWIVPRNAFSNLVDPKSRIIGLGVMAIFTSFQHPEREGNLDFQKVNIQITSSTWILIFLRSCWPCPFSEFNVKCFPNKTAIQVFTQGESLCLLVRCTCMLTLRVGPAAGDRSASFSQTFL